MLPNFILIGAAKAGTTSLHHYLGEHPEVFMTPVKDPSYFAYGVDADGKLLWGDPEFHDIPVTTLPEYERLFAEVGEARAVGEASTMYLECPQAAGRIQRLIPGARILANLRHPVDRAYSDYLMFLRRRGRRFNPGRDLTPSADWAQPESRWMQIGRYHDQLRRYYDVFPREQIHVVLFDDLKRDQVAAVQEVYRFLGVDPAFVPDFDTPHAPGGVPSSLLLEGLFIRSAKSAVKPIVPKTAANWVRRLRTRNLQEPPKMPAEMKRELTRPFRDDITRTGELLGRSLEHWL